MLVPLSETMVAERQREQIEGGERSILLEIGHARNRPGEEGDDETGDQPACGHREQIEPETRKPIAAPGRMACAMASPTRLMRRSIRKTRPDRHRARARACRQRTAHELELGERGYEGRTSTVCGSEISSGPRLIHALRRAMVECLAHAARGQKVLRRQHRRGAAPGDRLAPATASRENSTARNPYRAWR